MDDQTIEKIEIDLLLDALYQRYVAEAALMPRAAIGAANVDHVLSPEGYICTVLYTILAIALLATGVAL